MTKSQLADATFVGRQHLYDCPNTVQHWQLRDLVSCSGNVLYLAYQSSILQFDLQTCQVSDIAELWFAPTCMTVSGDIIACGGSGGQLDVRRRSDGAVLHHGYAGHAMNNAVQIGADASGEARLFVSSNDTRVRVFALPSMAHLTTVQCPWGVNYAAPSPCGRRLACVGDGPCALLFAAAPAGYAAGEALEVSRDDVSMAAWSPSGACLAIACQERRSSVWDPCSGQAVMHLATRGACRSVKFSGPDADLVAFGEHADVAHVVDARSFSGRQVLEVAGEGGSGAAISGLAFSPGGRRLFAGLGSAGAVAAFDVDLLARTTFGVSSLC